jgi:hypothetical protein
MYITILHKEELEDTKRVIEGQTTQCTEEKGQRYKQRSTKHTYRNNRDGATISLMDK